MAVSKNGFVILPVRSLEILPVLFYTFRSTIVQGSHKKFSYLVSGKVGGSTGNAMLLRLWRFGSLLVSFWHIEANFRRLEAQ